MKQLLILLTFILTISSCSYYDEKQKQPGERECRPFFFYDKIEHYRITVSEGKIWDLESNENRTPEEDKYLEMLSRYFPDELEDTMILKDLEKFGYKKALVSREKFDKIDEIFCSRYNRDDDKYSCLTVFRDILIFKKENEIIGVAKVCFNCGQNHIIGTNNETLYFGNNGDYDRLYELLY
ncbi:MAG: hypothetical protein H7321_00195 [Bacteroidia bacterium]|nr:hypothetical protein [Bacteroidia bacterium]